MSERGGVTPTPTDELRKFADEWARLGQSQGTIGQREDLIAAFTAAFITTPITEYVSEVNAMGEWQARARRVINAANAVFDVNMTKPGHDIGGALVVLNRTLIANDFREETPR